MAMAAKENIVFSGLLVCFSGGEIEIPQRAQLKM